MENPIESASTRFSDLQCLFESAIEKSMKTIPSYPTRHPNWIDTDEDFEPEKPSWKSRFIRTGLSFKWAFFLVLVFHVVLVGGIYAIGQFKPKAGKSVASNAANDPSDNGPKSDALARNKWPQPETKPALKDRPPVPKQIASRPDKQKPAVPTPVVAKVAPTKPPVSQSTPNPALASAKLPRKTPPTLNPEDATIKEKFLTAKNSLQPSQNEIPVREAIPATSNNQPLAKANCEIPQATSPVASTSSVPKQQEAPRFTPQTSAPTEYTLCTGDNLYAVSRRFQVPYNDLMVANGITDPRQLRIGQKLKLPERKTDSTCSL